MDLKSYDRWDDYTRARDEMFAATDTAWAPWYVADSDDKKRVRLNVISRPARARSLQGRRKGEKVKLPKRKIGRYKAADHPFKYREGTLLIMAHPPGAPGRDRPVRPAAAPGSVRSPRGR